MKIGLIGAPGSGKSDLANAIVDSTGLRMIDAYAEEVEARMDWALGKHATYAGNIAVALHRYAYERERKDGYITCGTMVDTVTYLAAKHSFLPPDELDTRRQTGGLVVLGCMVEDMMDYDHLFLLPSQPEDPFLAEVAQGLEQAVDVFALSWTLLDQATLEDRVAALFAHVNWADASG